MCTPTDQYIDSRIELIVVLSGERVKTEQEQIPDFFWPVTGKWGMRGTSQHPKGRVLTQMQICTKCTSTMRVIIVAMGERMSFMVSTHYMELSSSSVQINVSSTLHILLEPTNTKIQTYQQCFP